MTDTTNTKKQFRIFLMVAYGVTYIMGLLTWYGSTIPAELSVFPNAQMFYPAAGVMLAYLLTQWKKAPAATIILHKCSSAACRVW